MPFPYTFGSLAGTIPLSDLDANFAVCAFASDLVATNAVVAALPGSSIPIKPAALGVAGVAATLSKVDHQHPNQQANINLQTGTTYTVVASDNGATIELSNASAIAVTIPALGAEFNCLFVQVGAGQATFSGSGGVTPRNASSLTKTRAQWSQVSMYIRANGTDAVLGGDMA